MHNGRVGLIALLAITALSLSSVQALDVTINDEYTSLDVVEGSYSVNAYRLHIPEGCHVSYSFKVQGAGTIEVLMAQGTEVQIINNYYVYYYVDYSTSSPRTSYSNTFTPPSEEGSDFSIIITTESNDNITYSASISIIQQKNETSYGSILCGVVFILVIIYLVLKVVRKKGMHEQMYACPLCGKPKKINPITKLLECEYCFRNAPPPPEATLIMKSPPLQDAENAPIVYCPKCGATVNRTASKIIICPRCGRL